MANQVSFPSLSEDGWIRSNQKIGDNMLAHFLVSNFSQTILYPGLISSFPYILAVNDGNISAIISETQRVLGAYFGHYFERVAVEVLEIDNLISPSKAIVSIAVDFMDSAGLQYSVGESIRLVDSVFEKVTAINNG